MGSPSREDETPRARRREAGSGRGCVVMVGGRRRWFLKFTLFEWEEAIRQGATDARSAGARGRAEPVERLRPSGERGSGQLTKNKWAAAGPAGHWADWAEREEVFGLDFKWALSNKI
jgi:hypothetical protein